MMVFGYGVEEMQVKRGDGLDGGKIHDFDEVFGRY